MNQAVSASQQTQEKKEYAASDKAVYLMRNGRRLTSLYAESAAIHDDSLAQAKADILAETYRPQNIYYSEDQVNFETGELFDGYGVLVSGLCTRVSPAYLSASARRSRKRIKAKIAEAKPLSGQEWYFLTLTLPYLRADVETVMEVLDRALETFKKRSLWRNNVDLAFLAEEMTIGAETRPINTHYHIHAHILMLSKRIDQWRLGDLWTDCVERACAKIGVECPPITNLQSNRLITDIRDVRKYARQKQMSMDDAVAELCKYTTKGSEYEKVPPREIVEIEKALHNRKMIKTYENERHKDRKALAKDTSLDTQCITDAIDTKRLLDKAIEKTRRRESLAQMGARLIAEGRVDEWKEMLRLVFASRREFRIDQLTRRYACATFRTLTGYRWYGASKRPPKSNMVTLVNYWERRREKPKPAELLIEIVDRHDNAQLLDEILMEYEKRSWLEYVGIAEKKPSEGAESSNKPPLRITADLPNAANKKKALPFTRLLPVRI